MSHTNPRASIATKPSNLPKLIRKVALIISLMVLGALFCVGNVRVVNRFLWRMAIRRLSFDIMDYSLSWNYNYLPLITLSWLDRPIYSLRMSIPRYRLPKFLLLGLEWIWAPWISLKGLLSLGFFSGWSLLVPGCLKIGPGLTFVLIASPPKFFLGLGRTYRVGPGIIPSVSFRGSTSTSTSSWSFIPFTRFSNLEPFVHVSIAVSTFTIAITWCYSIVRNSRRLLFQRIIWGWIHFVANGVAPDHFVVNFIFVMGF